VDLGPKPKPSLLGMLWSPVEQFEKIRQRPTIWIAMLLVTVLTAIGTLLMMMGMDMSSVIGDGMSAEELALVEMFTKVTGAITGLFIPIFSVLISSAIVLAIAKIANKDVTFKQLFSMNTYIYFIPALGVLINGLIRMFIGGNAEILVTSVAGFINSDSSLLGAIELFSIWHLLLFGMGLNKVARLSKGASWTITIIFFLFQIGMAAISGMMAGLGGQ
jgi:hypothetical protein